MYQLPVLNRYPFSSLLTMLTQWDRKLSTNFSFSPSLNIPHSVVWVLLCGKEICMTAHQNICWYVLNNLSFLLAPQKQKSSRLVQNTLMCPCCYQWLQPDNHRMRLRPKRRPSAWVQKVLRRNARGKRLSLVQKNLLHRFQKSSSVLVRLQNTTTPQTWLCIVLHCSILSLHKDNRGICLICILSYSGVELKGGMDSRVVLVCRNNYNNNTLIYIVPFQNKLQSTLHTKYYDKIQQTV